ncbi:MAG: FecR domain-containing protein [Anaerolineales bacterium]|nr:FecR domain-containing protein [Anaerolineales bacterium]
MNKYVFFTMLLVLTLLAGCTGKEQSITLAPPTAPHASDQATATPPDLPSPTQLPTVTDTPSPTDTPAPTPTPTGPQAIVEEVVNEVSAHASTALDWQPAEVSQIVYLGGEVWAKEASTALLGMGSGRVRVAPNTVFSLAQTEDQLIQIDLEEGQIWINVEGLEPGTSFEIQTPAAVAAVRGTRFSVRVAEDGFTTVSSWQGQVEVSNEAGTVSVDSGMQSEITPGQAPTPPTMMTEAENLRWGMAQGPGLQPLLPLVGDPAMITVPGQGSGFAWSGNGAQFVFMSFEDTSIPQFVFYNTTSAEISMPPLSSNVVDPIFTMDGGEVNGILYINTGVAGGSLCKAALDGSNETCFVQGVGYIVSFIPSPDGQWLLFSADDGIKRNLFVVRPDGSDLRQVTQLESGEANYPIWSPSGDRIAYVYSANWSQPAELWVIGADGSGAQLLFDDVDPGSYSALVWSPDEQWLAIPTFSEGLALVQADGSRIVQVTNTTAGDYRHLSWTPVGSGWPLFYHYSGDEGEGLYYLASIEAEPTPIGGSDLSGPFWTMDGTQAAFISTTLVDGRFNTVAYFFQAMLGFLP